MHFEIHNEEPQIWTWLLIDTDSRTVVTGGTAPLQDECFEQIRAFKKAVADAPEPPALTREWT